MTADPKTTGLSLVLLVADLSPCGQTAQARVLAEAMAAAGRPVAIVSLEPAAHPVVESLRARGIVMHVIPVRHYLDVGGLRRVRRCLADLAPAVVHAWGQFAAGIAPLVVGRGDNGTARPRLAASAAAGGRGLGRWFTARQLRRADRVIAATRVEGEQYRLEGVSGERLTLIAPPAPAPPPAVDRSALLKRLGLPAAARILVGGGRTQNGIGPKDAVIAFDMLRYENPTLHLVLFGTGREAAELEGFSRALAFDDFRIHFAKCDPERAAVVPAAFAMLITHTVGSLPEALEAMAAGIPVVGWRTPEMLELVDDGATGFLVNLGDRTTLAARVQKLLNDPAMAMRMGSAARERARGHFGIERALGQFDRLYRELGGCPV